MHKFLEYALLFVVVVLLQAFLFSRIGLSVYIHPLAYVAFIILLPTQVSKLLLLLLGLLLGATMDILMGTAGINTIATLFVAFIRPSILPLVIGRDEASEAMTPNVNKIGLSNFIKYATTIIILHSTLFFTFESLTWHYYYLTFLRIVVSSAITLLLVYFYQKLFSVSNK